MNISGLNILAVDGDSGFEWVVPLIVFAIWIVGGIAKVIGSAAENRRERQKQAEGNGDRQMRYKPISDTSESRGGERTFGQTLSPERNKRINEPPEQYGVAPERYKEIESESYESQPKRGSMASWKKAMQDAMKDAHRQQEKRHAQKAAISKARKVKLKKTSTAAGLSKAHPVIMEPVKEIELEPQWNPFSEEMLDIENVRKGIIFSEILRKPLAMRDQY